MFSVSPALLHQQVFAVHCEVSGVESEGVALVVMVLFFACAIMAFQPNIIRAFLMQEPLKLVPFWYVPYCPLLALFRTGGMSPIGTIGTLNALHMLQAAVGYVGLLQYP